MCNRSATIEFMRLYLAVVAVDAGLILAGCGPTPSSIGSMTPLVTQSPVPAPTYTPTPTRTPTATPGLGIDNLMLTPNALASAAQLDEARIGYLSLVAMYPNKAEPLLALAALAQRENNLAGAHKYFELAASADPENMEALRLWAIFLEQQGRYNELVVVYDKVVALDPNNPDLLVARAGANARVANFVMSIADLETATSVDPSREYAWLNVVGSAESARQYETAIQIAEAGLELYPTSTGLQLSQALSYLSLMDNDNAIESLDAILLIDPDNAVALHWKGRALLYLEKYPESAELLMRAADVGSEGGVEGVNLSYESAAYAADALSRSDVRAAFEFLANKVFEYGSRDGLLLGYALVRWRQGNYGLALGQLDVLVNAGFLPAIYWRGVIQAEQGNSLQAIADLKNFTSLTRSGPDVEAAYMLLESVDDSQP